MFNYCTLSYSCAWWNWARWERELDFLAMNGINTPLGMVGLEGVWYNTLTKHGFTDEEARAFLVGPAFFAWQWMTNLEGHGGPLPKHWIDERVKLGQLWMARARELGMTPIQQGFSGNVPRLLKQKHPEAAIALQPSWCGFQGSAQLDPTDPLFNDCVYDMIWRNQAVEIDPWLTAYATRRYGAASAKADAAWQILLNDGPYKRGTSGVESSSMIAARPALVVKKSGPNAGFRIPYPPLKLLEAAELLLQESVKLGNAEGYQYDVVDITRQILSNYTQQLHQEIRLAYATKDKAMFAAKTAAFRQVLLDVDTLLASRPEFLFGKMLADARSFGATPAESEQYAWNAAMQVTIWGPATDQDGESIRIFDYSWREWSGLIKEYYLPRWKKFHTMLGQTIDKGDYRDPDSQVHGRESLRANPFYSQLADWEIAFAHTPPKDLPAKPRGDAVALAKQMLAKYRPVLELAYAPESQTKLADRLNDKASLLTDGTIQIGQWKSNEITTKGREITLDVTKGIKDEGDYEITFIYQSGGKRLEIEWVALLVNGNEIMRDSHLAWAGSPVKANTFKVNPGAMVLNGKYEIRAKVRTDGGNTSNGIITLRKR
jgi:alpha-N-acetylglucosaminidase